MSVTKMAEVWKYSGQSGTSLLMLLAIADFADDDGRAYPAVATLAGKCRMKSRNANVLLAKLRESGELQVRPGAGPSGTNLYRIPPLQSLASMQSITPLQSLASMQSITPLQGNASTPAKLCSNPLQGSAGKPSVNHQGTTKRGEKAKTRIPDGWQIPDEWSMWAAQNLGWSTEKCAAVSDMFADHWRSKGESRADWFATWRNWCRRENVPRAGQRPPPAAEGFSGRDYGKGGRL